MTNEAKVQKQYPRFRLMARIEHFILMTSFTVLAVTGLPQKYAASDWAVSMIEGMGGIELVRQIHHVAAFVLVVGSVYHLFTSAYRLFVKRERMRIALRKKDFWDVIDTVRYNLGMISEHPKMTKFNFGEKLEYWAVVWGTAVMAITGFMLWNPISTTAVVPGSFIPAAKAAHGGEAVLAVLSILIWHMYNVHIKHFNPSIFTGKLSHEQMEEEHALELERLEEGGDPWPGMNLEVLQHRRRIFLITSVIVSSIILVVLVWAFTFEQTAITTIPRVTREVFVPLATPIP
ncbi:MAG: cytochrome b/b6 domain-containing protein [Anaerolineales bacterium]|nr:cytochrome b/b6 domain-containing protein [Anaerolineales bacterium]